MGMEREPRADLAQCATGREHTSNVLRGRARMLTDQAAKLNNLADMVQHMRGDAEGILHELVWAGLRQL